MADFSELFKSADEHLTPVEAAVKGTLPPWLCGCLIRLGPGKFDLAEDFVMNHWLDGYAILYKFDIANAKVQFCSKFLHSEAYERAVNVGRPVYTEFGTRTYPDPCKNIFSRMMSTLTAEMTDNNSINVFTLEDSVYVASETNWLHRVDPRDLETCDKVDLHKIVGVNYASSHPCKDAKGDMYNMGSTLNLSLKYHLFKIPSTSSNLASEALDIASIVGTIPSSWKTLLSYYHSFGLSENYAVFIEQPLTFNGLRLLTMLVKGDKSLKECLEWRPQEKNRFFVINKSSGKLIPIKYKSEDAFFLFHHINTYEEDGMLIVDVLAYDSPDILDKLYLEKLRLSEFNCSDPAGGRRFVLPLPKEDEKQSFPEHIELLEDQGNARAIRRGDTVYLKPQYLSHQVGYELPTINRSYATKKYNYYYGCGMYDPGPFRNSLVKVDIESGEIMTWRQDEYTYPGEAQFVPRPSGLYEDDGVLLCGVTDVRTSHPDFLLVLDAATMIELARAEVTIRVPPLMHGVFVN